MKYPDWSSAIKRLGKNIPKESTEVFVRAVCLKALGSIVIKSPVDTGLFRNNWFISINGNNSETRQIPDSGGSNSLSETSKLSQLKSNPYVRVFISNSLPYAVRLEHGWSKQAPLGMVNVTAGEIENWAASQHVRITTTR